MDKGLLIIISGPSGVGKGTIRKELMEYKDINLVYSVSMTTRQPRPQEVDGVDYFFVSEEQFANELEAGNFLETAQFVGNCYGTPKRYVEALRKQGKNVILEIEIDGATQVIKQCAGDKGLVTIFLMPPSFELLEARIRGRRTENEATIQERLSKAKHEMTLKDNYVHVVINDDIKRTADEIYGIIKETIKSLSE